MKEIKKHKNMWEGSQILLAVYVNDQEAFFIDLINHNEWHLQERLKAIHDERPDLIEHRVVNNIKGDVLSDEEIYALRSKGYNYMLDIGGNCYRGELLSITGGTFIQGFIFSHQLKKLICNIVREILIDGLNNVDDISVCLEEVDFNKFTYAIVSLRHERYSKKYKILI